MVSTPLFVLSALPLRVLPFEEVMGRVSTPKQSRAAALLIAPTMIVLAIVIGYPIVRAIWLSFQADKGLDPTTGVFTDGGFAGLEHYLYWTTQRCMSPSGAVSTCPPGVLATDFWPALRITLFFTVVTVALETLLGMWMATVMNRDFKGRGMLRAAVLIPGVPTAVTAKLWQFIFADHGIINSLLGTHVHWTTDPWAARIAVIIADVWKTTPFMALLYSCRPANDPQGPVRGRARGWRFPLANVHTDHDAAGQTSINGGSPVPNLGRAAHVRPACDLDFLLLELPHRHHLPAGG